MAISQDADSWEGFMDGSDGFSDDFDIERDALPDDVERKSLTTGSAYSSVALCDTLG